MVYINFNQDHLSESSKLELHLPHWASEREDVFTAVAPHKVDKNGQYNFLLSPIEESPHAPSVIIHISGHTSLFAVALQYDCQKSYLLLPFYYNQSKTELIVFVTYHCTVWCEVSIYLYVCLILYPFYSLYTKITQGIYNHPGIKCKNGHREIASQIIDSFYLVDKIFAQFFLLDESCIYSAHVGT